MNKLIWSPIAYSVTLLVFAASVSMAAAQGRSVPVPTRLMVAQGMMGGGMMGGGMMGRGMNGQSPQGETASNPAAQDLVGYVRSNGLGCFSCHSVGTRRIGPAFDDVAKRYAGQSNAQGELARSIANGATGKWAGYPAMPGGLASQAQASNLATLILALQSRGGQ